MNYSASLLHRIALSGAFAVVFLLAANSADARYPRDGRFKQLEEARDWWYYVDKYNWEIKAPDKWTHMMGSMASTATLSTVINKYMAGAVVFGLGLYKEYDDAFREGWSYRDIIMDGIGVVASWTATDRYRLYMNYDNEKVMLLLNVTLR